MGLYRTASRHGLSILDAEPSSIVKIFAMSALLFRTVAMHTERLNRAIMTPRGSYLHYAYILGCTVLGCFDDQDATIAEFYMQCKTYSFISMLPAKNQRFDGPDRGSEFEQ